jgi:AcrR family transcriptional regulator
MRNRAGIETRERILDAARTLLSERGLEGTTVKAICDTAGVRAGSFYNLFESKEEVLLAVMRQAIQAVDPNPDNTGGEHVADLVEAYIRFVQDQPVMARVYLVIAITGSLTDESIAQRISKHQHDRLTRVRAALRTARTDLTDEEVDARAEAMVAALNGYTMQALLDHTFDFAAHARRLLSMEPAGSAVHFGSDDLDP